MKIKTQWRYDGDDVVIGMDTASGEWYELMVIPFIEEKATSFIDVYRKNNPEENHAYWNDCTEEQKRKVVEDVISTTLGWCSKATYME